MTAIGIAIGIKLGLSLLAALGVWKRVPKRARAPIAVGLGVAAGIADRVVGGASMQDAALDVLGGLGAVGLHELQEAATGRRYREP